MIPQTPTARDTLLRWSAMIALHGSEPAALAALLRKAEELDLLKKRMRGCGISPEGLLVAAA